MAALRANLWAGVWAWAGHECGHEEHGRLPLGAAPCERERNKHRNGVGKVKAFGWFFFPGTKSVFLNSSAFKIKLLPH